MLTNSIYDVFSDEIDQRTIFCFGARFLFAAVSDKPFNKKCIRRGPGGYI
jgi:hypothetical protein